MGRFAEGKKPLSEAVARTRDDRDRSSALRAGLDVHLKHTLKA
jgi:hypothetical protein